MSGIEVVGIVLGALPLAISLFQSYEDLAAAKNRLRDFEKLYRNIQRDLEHEELLFRLIVETLIRPLVNDEMIDKDDLDRIINNIDDSSWANQDISEALQQRLGEVHEPFIEVMKDTKPFNKDFDSASAEYQVPIYRACHDLVLIGLDSLSLRNF